MIDDDAEYALLVQIALQEIGVENRVVVVSDGAEAIAYLRCQGAFHNRDPRAAPVLVLSDLRMPRMTGLEFLSWKRNQHDLKHLCIGVLTGTEIGDDRQHSLDLGASFFRLKPFAFQDLVQVATEIRDRFLIHARSIAEAA